MSDLISICTSCLSMTHTLHTCGKCGAAKEDNRMLAFKRPLDIGAFGKAMKAYSNLVMLLTGSEPNYKDFTAWLEREGYVG